MNLLNRSRGGNVELYICDCPVEFFWNQILVRAWVNSLYDRAEGLRNHYGDINYCEGFQDLNFSSSGLHVVGNQRFLYLVQRDAVSALMLRGRVKTLRVSLL